METSSGNIVYQALHNQIKSPTIQHMREEKEHENKGRVAVISS